MKAYFISSKTWVTRRMSAKELVQSAAKVKEPLHSSFVATTKALKFEPHV